MCVDSSLPHGEILIVEDNKPDLKLMSEILTKAGYRTRAAGDGELALRSVQVKLPDLILLDINLPGIKGVEVCRSLKVDPRTKDIPVIFISALGEIDLKVMALKAGGTDYVTKPFEAPEVLARINTHLNIYQLQQRLAIQSEELRTEIGVRKQTEEALRESEVKNKALQEAAFEAIFFSEKGICIEANTSAARMFGYEQDELIGVLATELIADEYIDIVTEKIMSGYDKPYEAIAQRKDGSKFWAEARGKMFDYHGKKIRVTSVRDITEQKKLQEDVLKAHKLESLGILAGGIAHDFNNLLCVIMGNISLAQDDLKPGIGMSENLRAAEDACIKAKELSAQLITFSKGGDPVKEISSIGDLLKDAVISALRGFNIKPVISIDDAVGQVDIDEIQIKQAVRNIVANAREAMDDKGQFTVSCENIDIAKESCLTLSQGKYIKISFKDQGCGISKENLKKIFDPYFSTKERGTDKGQGLGLTVSYSIIKKHGGLITVESELETGSTFSVYLPAAGSVNEPDLQKSEGKLAALKPVKQLVTGKKKILLMDDEETIRIFMGQLINRLGYDVKTCIEGKETLEIYKKAFESKEPFDLVILDLTNNFGMGGQETMKRLLEIDHNARGIVITGYFDDPVVTNFRAYGFSGFLTKPATKGELSRVINEVISKEVYPC